MKNLHRSLIAMQWVVLTVVVIGATVIIVMLASKTEDYKHRFESQNSNISSLREQLRQAKNPTPTPYPPLPEANGGH